MCDGGLVDTVYSITSNRERKVDVCQLTREEIVNAEMSTTACLCTSKSLLYPGRLR